MQAIDLHLHSQCSDGALPVRQLLQQCVQGGLGVVAVADHDTLSQLVEVELAQAPLYVVPAVEVTTEWDGKEIHVLVYFPSVDGGFAQRLEQIYKVRCERFHWIVGALKAAGWQLDVSVLYEWCDSPWVIAAACVRCPENHKRLQAEQIQTVRGFHAAYMAYGASAYAPRWLYPVAELLSTVRDESAISVWAHPAATISEVGRLSTAVAGLTRLGLHGLEVFYGSYTAVDTRRVRALRDEYGLLESAGSDFHTPTGGQGIGGWESYGLAPELSWVER